METDLIVSYVIAVIFTASLIFWIIRKVADEDDRRKRESEQAWIREGK